MQQARLLGEDQVPEEEKKPYELKTKGGYRFDEVVSTLTKEIRRGNEDLALFWALELVDSGYDAYFWRRLSVIVPEDIGLVNLELYSMVNACAQMYERRRADKKVKTEELVGAVILALCRSPKSGEVGHATYATWEERAAGRKEPIPEYGQDMHTAKGREMIEKAGLTKEDQEIWWHEELSQRHPLQPGNRWIRRYIESDAWLGESSQALKEGIIQQQLKLYQETEENQLLRTENEGGDF